MSEVLRSESKVAGDKDSTWSTARSLTTPDARTYSEWVLLVEDLQYSLRRAELWSNRTKSGAGDADNSEICASLFRDAVVSLVACFDNTLRVHLDPTSVYAETPGAPEYFRWLETLRHTWIGHRGGTLRQCVAAVVIDESTGDLQGTGELHHMYLGPRAEASEDLGRMMRIALDHAQRELKRHAAAVEDYAKGMTGCERLRLPAARLVVPGPEEIRIGRRKFQNIKGSRKRKKSS